MRQEFISFHLDIPKEREDLIDMARWLVGKVKNLIDTKTDSTNDYVYNTDIKNNDRVKEFKQLFGGLVVDEIPRKEDLKELRIKRYAK